MTPQQRDRLWDLVWDHCAGLGMVDDLGGAEYRRLKSLWIIDGRPWKRIGVYVTADSTPPGMRSKSWLLGPL